MKEGQIRCVFESIDADGDGFIDEEEILEVFKAQGVDLNGDEVGYMRVGYSGHAA